MRFRKARALLLLGGGLFGLLQVATGCQMESPKDPSANLWLRELGTVQDDALSAVTSVGNFVYAAGRTAGHLPGDTSSTQQNDAMLVSLDQNGTVVWQKQLGTSGNEEWRGVASDAAGNAFVVGFTDRAFDGQTSAGGDTDAVIAHIKPDGSLDWLRQFGTSSADYLLGVTVDSAGNAYAAGWTSGTFSGKTLSGTSDGFVVKYGSDGTPAWLSQFGCPKEDSLTGIALLGDSLYVSGWATDAVASGQTPQGARDAAVYKLQAANGSVVWGRQFGTSAVDEAAAVAVDATSVYVAGDTLGTLPTQSNAGRIDALVGAYDLAGNQRWIRQFGTLGDDQANAITAATDGSGVYVGGVIGRAFLGGTWGGQGDALYTKLRSDGSQDWSSQFGTASNDAVLGLFSPSVGVLYAVGSAGAALSGQQFLGGSNDAFVGRYSVP